MGMSEGRATIVGAGPAGLMAAEVLLEAGVSVTVFDRMPSPGRKFLMAGRGGLNLTHSEPFEAFVEKYGAATPHLTPAIHDFPPASLRAWSEALGQTTFVGTSGRIFPAAMKASPLLRSWMARLTEQGAQFCFRETWTGWSETGALMFEAAQGARHEVKADAAILALGGASWPRLGSDGGWTEALQASGVELEPFTPASRQGTPRARLRQPAMQVPPGARLFCGERDHATSSSPMARISASTSRAPARHNARATATAI
jgi:predicted Rossmann fold flavoprotein